MNRVKDTDNEGLLIMEDPDQPRFRRFEAAFGWRDPTGSDHEARHALLVGGELEDGRFVVLEEIQGEIQTLLTEAINIKDRLLLKRIVCDASDPEIMRLLHAHDGLSHYQNYGRNERGETIWDAAIPGDTWPWFRDRSTKCAILGVPLSLRSSPISGVDRLIHLGIGGQNILQIDSTCQQTLSIADEMVKQLSNVQNHPIFRALMYLIWAYETFGFRQEPIMQNHRLKYLNRKT